MKFFFFAIFLFLSQVMLAQSQYPITYCDDKVCLGNNDINDPTNGNLFYTDSCYITIPGFSTVRFSFDGKDKHNWDRENLIEFYLDANGYWNHILNVDNQLCNYNYNDQHYGWTKPFFYNNNTSHPQRILLKFSNKAKACNFENDMGKWPFLREPIKAKYEPGNDRYIVGGRSDGQNDYDSFETIVVFTH